MQESWIASPCQQPKPKKMKTSAASGNQGHSHMQSGAFTNGIGDNEYPLNKHLNKYNPTANIKEFFSLASQLPGQPKRHMKCNLCI